MSVLRKKLDRDYTVIDNAALTDPQLTWAARGMLAYLLTKPDGWEVRESHLVSASEGQGITTVRTALACLERAGYLWRGWGRDARGRLRRLTDLADRPAFLGREPGTKANAEALTDCPPAAALPEPAAAEPEPEPATEPTESGFSDVGFSDVGKPEAIVSTDSNQVLNQEEEHTLHYVQGVAGATAPPPAREPSAHDRMFTAVCAATGFDPGLLDTTTRTAVGKLARRLRVEQDATPEDVAACAADWYAVKFARRPRASVTPPSIAQFTTWFGQWRTLAVVEAAAADAPIDWGWDIAPLPKSGAAS